MFDHYNKYPNQRSFKKACAMDVFRDERTRLR